MPDAVVLDELEGLEQRVRVFERRLKLRQPLHGSHVFRVDSGLIHLRVGRAVALKVSGDVEDRVRGVAAQVECESKF